MNKAGFWLPWGCMGPVSGASPLRTAQRPCHSWEARLGQGGTVERVRLAWSRILAGRAICSGLFRSDTAGPLSERSELLAPPDLGRPERMVAVCLRSRARRPGPRLGGSLVHKHPWGCTGPVSGASPFPTGSALRNTFRHEKAPNASAIGALE